MNEYITKLVQEMIWKPKPLSDEELLSMTAELFHYTEYQQAIKFARMIEQRHRIK